ncbi:hypothetical protein [Priestia megaterium]|nr:hypothetical protein [Priestia megaterium]
MLDVGFMYVGASSCRLRKVKSCMEINSGVTSSPAHVSHLFVFSLE